MNDKCTTSLYENCDDLQVNVIGDGRSTPVVVAGDKLVNHEELVRIGSSIELPASIKDTRAILSNKVFEWVLPSVAMLSWPMFWVTQVAYGVMNHPSLSQNLDVMLLRWLIILFDISDIYKIIQTVERCIL